jgi:lysozyme
MQRGSIIVATERLLEFVKFHEQFRAEAYPDAGYGWARPTIGYGRTEGTYRGERTTIEHEERWLHDKLGYIADSIIELINPDVRLNQNQLDALTSFVYNVGFGDPDNPDKKPGFRFSTLRRRLNAGDFEGAAAEFPRWNQSNGKVLKGLVLRRKAEMELFRE